MKTTALKLFAVALLIPILQACAPAESQSATDTVSWTLPTEYTNGAPLPPAQIASVTVMWGTSVAGPFNAGTQTVAGPATSAQLVRPGDGIGTRCYTAFVTGTNGQAGEVAVTPACKTIDPPPPIPGAPTNVTVE